MSHEVETMAYAGAVPWHRLGTKVADDLTPDEFLVAAGLDWEVEKRPMTMTLRNGMRVEIPDRFAMVRNTDEAFLSIVSERFHPVQNRELLQIMDSWVRAGGARIETAGSLKGGRIIWALANLDHGFQVTPGDQVNGYVLLTGSHEAGRATSGLTTTVRVVCKNTLQMAESSDHQKHFRQTHRGEFDAESAKRQIALAHDQLRLAESQARILSELKLSMQDAIDKVLLPVFAPDYEPVLEAPAGTDARDLLPRNIRQILASVEEAPGAIEGNGWGVLNGVTHWADHKAGHNSDTRMASAWTGVNMRRKQQVQDVLLELAE